MPTDELTGYEGVLERLHISGSQDLVNNSSKEHAAIMIKTIFRHANGVVRIFTDHLKGSVYDRRELKEVVQQFLAKDVNNRISIILQFKEEPLESLRDNGFVALLLKHSKQIEMRKATGQLLALSNHFMVAQTDEDKYAMRFELDVAQHVATGSFNAGFLGEQMVAFFDAKCKEADTIEIDKIFSLTMRATATAW